MVGPSFIRDRSTLVDGWNWTVATVFKPDPLDPARGKRYRDKILRVGGSQEELDSLKVRVISKSGYTI